MCWSSPFWSHLLVVSFVWWCIALLMKVVLLLCILHYIWPLMDLESDLESFSPNGFSCVPIFKAWQTTQLSLSIFGVEGYISWEPKKWVLHWIKYQVFPSPAWASMLFYCVAKTCSRELTWRVDWDGHSWDICRLVPGPASCRPKAFQRYVIHKF